MLDMVIGLISNLVQLGLKLYKERSDKHEQLIKQWEELQARAVELEGSLRQFRSDRDAASLKRLEELERGQSLAAQLAAKVPE